MIDTLDERSVMNTARICPQCAKPLASDAPEGLCPECLFKAALASQTVLGSAEAGLEGEKSPSTQTINPAIGRRVRYFGDYELLEEIARGGMGVVWKGRQNSLNRIVAIKMILAGKLAGAAEVQRFLREAEAAANLQHPNIVAIHEVGEHDGQHYFSMDYVEGRDLGSLVRDGALPAQRAARYVKIIAEAIHFAHQRGTLHRDLKPQNVLIDAADQPRITDFGLAKFSGHDSGLTQSGAVMGSPSYMPPEQAAGRHDQVGPHSDVYALGAILYELLTGQPPFRGATAMATMRAVIDSDPVAPHKLNPDVPPDLETICLKCLEKSPERRYHSARELAEDVSRFLNREPIHARPASLLRKSISWARRHPFALASVAALVMLDLAFFTFKLIEENAFLRAQQTTPGLIRQPGQRVAALDNWNLASNFASFFLIWVSLFIGKRLRGGSWRDLYDPMKIMQPTRPLGSRLRSAVAVLGLASVGFGFVFLAKLIQAHVWEGGVPSRYYSGVYLSECFGFMLLAQSIRDYQRTVFGRPSRQLSDHQIEAIRRAVLEVDIPGAVRLYRQAVPDAHMGEARDYARQIAADLQKTHPDKFVLPSLSLRTFNWRLIAICAAIEAAIGVVCAMVFPATRSAVFAYELTTGILIVLGVLVGARLKGFWKRMLAISSGPLMMAFIRELLPRSPDGPHIAGWSYFFGVAFGVFLMLSAYTKVRRKVVNADIRGL